MFSRKATLSGHAGAPAGIAISANGQVLVSTSEDKTIRIWETVTWSNTMVIADMDQETRQPITIFDVSPCGQYLATGMADFSTKAYLTQSGQRMKQIHPEKKSVFNVAEQIRFSPTGDLLACAKGRTIELFYCGDFSKVGELRGHTSKAHLIEWSPDGRTLISCGGKFVKLWDIAGMTERVSLTNHTRLLGSLAVAANGQFFLTGGEDNRILKWSLPEGTLLGEYTGHTNYVFDVAISPDGQTAASWDMDRSFHVWEVVSVRRLACLTGITGRSLFLPNSGVLIFYGPLAGTLIINAANGEIIQKLPPSEYAAVAPDGSWFASSDGNDVVVWSINAAA